MHKIDLPSYGVAMKFDCNDKQVMEKLKHIFYLQQQASVELGILFAQSEGKIVIMPCKQCLSDVALMFHDLSGAIKELVE